MTNPIEILVGADDDAVAIPIGFNFSFYGIPGNVQVYVGSNGILSFGSEAETNPNADGSWSNYEGGDVLPVFAPFWTNLVNGFNNATNPGSITWSLEDSAPNRQLLIRFNSVEYLGQSMAPVITGASFDVVLSETSNALEVRFYHVDPNPAPVSIGVHGWDEAPSSGLREADVSSLRFKISSPSTRR